MPDGFRSFASILAASAPPGRAEPERAAPAALASIAPAPSGAPTGAGDARVLDLLDGFVADLARLRARAAERLEEAIDAVVADLARRVLGRELHVAPVAIANLLDEALREFETEARVVVRVSAHDAQRIGTRPDVEVDPALGPGDFALEVDDGRFDATLQTRLDAMLASHRAAL
jgi:flagellar biosynthesis/type III secretory pathway protein FliH